MTLLVCGRFRLDLSAPKIMAILNLTDGSFSGDGLADNVGEAVRRAEAALEAGADMLDLGAESTRPGAVPVPVEMEIDRLAPVVERLLGLGVPLSVDTMKPRVMQAMLALGVDMINDIMALRAPGALAAVAGSRAAVCLMHMQGEPRTMQDRPHYQDVLAEVGSFLGMRAAAALAAGIAGDRIVLDPGFGFGKTLDHNLALLRGLPVLVQGGFPVLAGLSRKSMLGQITGQPVDARIHASVAAALLAVEGGGRIVRVHDVAATRDALKVWQATRTGGECEA